MVLLALRCIITDHRHRHLQHFIRRPALGLAGLQGPRGSFGSLRSTALAMQALQDLQLDSASTYNRTAASKWILDRQRSDGGWTEEPLQDGQDPTIGVGLTADIVLALGCKGLGKFNWKNLCQSSRVTRILFPISRRHSSSPMRSCCSRSKRQRWERGKWWRKDCTTGWVALDICRGHWTEERQLLVHALARIQHNGDLFASTCIVEKHELLQGDDAGSRSRLEVVKILIELRKRFL